MHIFKQTAVDQKALELQYSIYHCYTCRKISVLMVLIIEEYDLIAFVQNRQSVEASIHSSFFSVFFTTTQHKNDCNINPIKLY